MILPFGARALKAYAISAVIAYGAGWGFGSDGFNLSIFDFCSSMSYQSKDATGFTLRLPPVLVILLLCWIVASVSVSVTTYAFFKRLPLATEEKAAQLRAIISLDWVIALAALSFEHEWVAPFCFVWFTIASYVSGATGVCQTYVKDEWNSTTSPKKPIMYHSFLLVLSFILFSVFSSYFEKLSITKAESLASTAINEQENVPKDGINASVLINPSDSNLTANLNELNSTTKSLIGMDSAQSILLVLLVIPTILPAIFTQIADICRILLSKKSSESGFINNISISNVIFHIDTLLAMSIDSLALVHRLTIAFIWIQVGGSSGFIGEIILYFKIRSSWSSIRRTMNKRMQHHRMNAFIDKQFTEVPNPDIDDHCPMCWDEMPTGVKLPCNHIFHRDCLREWMKKTATCPTCRAELPKQSRAPLEHSWWRSIFEFLGWTMSREDTLRATQRLRNVFPDISADAIVDDLEITGSQEITANRILQGVVH